MGTLPAASIERTLSWVIKRQADSGRGIAIEHAVHIIVECCRLLAVLDRSPPDVVPRDISPETILISIRGTVSFASFDLAEVRGRVQEHVAGFSYLSPETASGREYDRRTDVFSLGIVLWELLTSARLFVGNTDYQTVELVRAARVPDIASRNPVVTPELAAIVRRALAEDPASRYPSTADFGEALARYLSSRGAGVTDDEIAALVSDRNDREQPN